MPVDQNLTVLQQQTDLKYGDVTINEVRSERSTAGAVGRRAVAAAELGPDGRTPRRSRRPLGGTGSRKHMAACAWSALRVGLGRFLFAAFPAAKV